MSNNLINLQFQYAKDDINVTNRPYTNTSYPMVEMLKT